MFMNSTVNSQYWQKLLICLNNRTSLILHLKTNKKRYIRDDMANQRTSKLVQSVFLFFLSSQLSPIKYGDAMEVFFEHERKGKTARYGMRPRCVHLILELHNTSDVFSDKSRLTFNLAVSLSSTAKRSTSMFLKAFNSWTYPCACSTLYIHWPSLISFYQHWIMNLKWSLLLVSCESVLKWVIWHSTKKKSYQKQREFYLTRFARFGQKI